MVEATVSDSIHAPGIGKLHPGLIKIGIATEGEGLMVGYGVNHSFEMVIVNITGIRCAKALGKTSNKPSLAELFVKTIKTRDTLIRALFSQYVGEKFSVKHWI
jgi:hypothetical protein